MPSHVCISGSEKLWRCIQSVQRLCHQPIQSITVRKLLSLRDPFGSRLTIVKEKQPITSPSSLPDGVLHQHIANAEWVRSQLILRLAHRLYDFHALPFYTLSNPRIEAVYRYYTTLLEALQNIAPVTKVDTANTLIKHLIQFRNPSLDIVQAMSQGVTQLRYLVPDVSMDGFLERFFAFRISVRLLVDHLLVSPLAIPLVRQSTLPIPDKACIELDCNPYQIIHSCVASTRASCRGSYALAPHVTITGNLDHRFGGVPDHLALVLTEVLKNAMRATVEFHTLDSSICSDPKDRPIVIDDTDLPKVDISVMKGHTELIIHICDKGGGIPFDQIDRVLQFGYSSVNESQEQRISNSLDGWVRPDIAGYGFGLPLARTFTRYFGGDIRLQPYYGIGTSVFIIFKNLTATAAIHGDTDITGDAKKRIHFA